MPRNRPSPSLAIISSSSPASPVSTAPSPSYRHSQSPFRFVKGSQTMDDEKLAMSETQLQSSRAVGKQRAASPSLAGTSLSSPNQLPHHPRQPSPFQRGPSPLLLVSKPYTSPQYTRPRGLRISNLIKPWIPLILYGITSFGFLVAIMFWKKEVFEGTFLYISFASSTH